MNYMIHEDFRFQDPRHQANRFWYGRWYIRKQCGVAYSSACSITNNITCDKSNPKPEKGEKSSYWMILNLRTLKSDNQMLFSNFPFVTHNKVVLGRCFAENKLNMAMKKHSFIIDEALNGATAAEDRQSNGRYCQRSTFRTILATSSSYQCSSSSYGCAVRPRRTWMQWKRA